MNECLQENSQYRKLIGSTVLSHSIGPPNVHGLERSYEITPEVEVAGQWLRKTRLLSAKTNPLYGGSFDCILQHETCLFLLRILACGALNLKEYRGLNSKKRIRNDGFGVTRGSGL